VWLEGVFFVWFLVLGGIYVALEPPGKPPARPGGPVQANPEDPSSSDS